MSQLNLTSPLVFRPIFQKRIWGGRRLAELFGKALPPNEHIGESWEIVDRVEAQSVVASGPLQGKTLHELWMHHREEVFGEALPLPSARFPLLIKLLDAHEKLSLQVHPPEKIATKLGGEPKTEFWYVAAAEQGAELFLGFRESSTRDQFEKALHEGTATDHVHMIPVKSGDAMFLPAGRLHAVGPGNLLIEIQQNSDTTYRVSDWKRIDTCGKPRQLHIEQALQCIDFNDVRPQLLKPRDEVLIRHQLFEIKKWNLDSPREISLQGQFAIVCCLRGSLRCGDADLSPGGFCLIPAQLRDRRLKPLDAQTTLLRITIPGSGD